MVTLSIVVVCLVAGVVWIVCRTNQRRERQTIEAMLARARQVSAGISELKKNPALSNNFSLQYAEKNLKEALAKLKKGDPLDAREELDQASRSLSLVRKELANMTQFSNALNQLSPEEQARLFPNPESK